MNETEYRRVIDELQAVLDATRATMARFEATGMDEQMSKDYAKLEVLATQVVKEQRRYVLQMLDISESPNPILPESP
ncbi:hypothetical protein HOP51_07180 [Halomonas sp. MCCC 1A11036]|uniref:Uncharacterized protein n=1 Tax=Billgrantia zhangzhouensis TaxID=2733481 RepID=A0ABS9ADU4_9GAMM|nr:hypothetical protein [Halomonas zhangzhouensis]MCE8019897.1 hypothetical protein [Halomonas zhangzhouensis]